jgi:hypothetical protein
MLDDDLRVALDVVVSENSGMMGPSFYTEETRVLAYNAISMNGKGPVQSNGDDLVIKVSR